MSRPRIDVKARQQLDGSSLWSPARTSVHRPLVSLHQPYHVGLAGFRTASKYTNILLNSSNAATSIPEHLRLGLGQGLLRQVFFGKRLGVSSKRLRQELKRDGGEILPMRKLLRALATH